MLQDPPTIWWVSAEARIMEQLDKLDDDAILYLRDFRTVAMRENGQYSKEGSIWRYYLELCPHGM